MISYRSLKKLVGETSLERKCRLLFGLALLILITASFWVYASRTRRMVENQQIVAAKTLVPQILQLRHYQLFLRDAAATGSGTATESGGQSADSADSGDDASGPIVDSGGSDALNLSTDEQTKIEPRGVGRVALPGIDSSDSSAAAHTPLTEFDAALNEIPGFSVGTKWSLLDRGFQPLEDDDGFAMMTKLRDPWGEVDEHWLIQEDGTGVRTLQLYAAVRLAANCVQCHQADVDRLVQAEDDDLRESGLSTEEIGEKLANERRPPLMAVIQVTMSMESVDSQLSRNKAVLLASAIVTSFLAMMVAYVIVRYIIVKPVLHLKDVSDEIARGNLNLRAEINTGDEFEELSHAFNRMLRHMMTVNDELRGLNDHLDARVDQLAQANMELFNNNKLKDDFLATMSHELRTPLNSILGFSDILHTAANLDDRQKRYVHNIQTSGQSLMVQINDLLDLAKIESGKMQVHPGDVRLADVIEQQVQQIMPLADRKNIDLRIDPPAKPLPLMFQDRGKIIQILTNLLSNAVKFTPEGGRVRVAFRQLDDATSEFSVEDTGIGIPLPEQEQIFEKFRQGSTTPGGRDHVKREYEGTGLGLSIVRELSRLLGGDVTLESEFGKGSLFVVHIPFRVPERREELQPQLETRSTVGLGRITSVNLLDDEADHRDVVGASDATASLAGTIQPALEPTVGEPSFGKQAE